jgi:hypothetical protein
VKASPNIAAGMYGFAGAAGAAAAFSTSAFSNLKGALEESFDYS